jgi:hypothetical protein
MCAITEGLGADDRMVFVDWRRTCAGARAW